MQAEHEVTLAAQEQIRRELEEENAMLKLACSQSEIASISAAEASAPEPEAA